MLVKPCRQLPCSRVTGHCELVNVWVTAWANLLGGGVTDITKRGTAALPRWVVSEAATAVDCWPASAGDGDIWTSRHWRSQSPWWRDRSSLWPSAFCKSHSSPGLLNCLWLTFENVVSSRHWSLVDVLIPTWGHQCSSPVLWPAVLKDIGHSWSRAVSTQYRNSRRTARTKTEASASPSPSRGWVAAHFWSAIFTVSDNNSLWRVLTAQATRQHSIFFTVCPSCRRVM